MAGSANRRRRQPEGAHHAGESGSARKQQKNPPRTARIRFHKVSAFPESFLTPRRSPRNEGRTEGCYLNLDGGFDSRHNRKAIFNAGLIPNIKENPRNRKTPKRGRKRLFNAAIHSLRLCVERTFAWEDKFKRLLLRFEFKQQRHYGMKLMAYTLINLRHFCGA
jgi:hypothetical protein